MNDRVKEIINQLKLQNKSLYAENKNLKAPAKQGYGEVDAEIGDLWVEFRRLKKANMKECEEAKKIQLLHIMLSLFLGVFSFWYFCQLSVVCKVCNWLFYPNGYINMLL